MKKYTGSCSSKSVPAGSPYGTPPVNTTLFSFSIPSGYVVIFVKATVTKKSGYWGSPGYLSIFNGETEVKSISLDNNPPSTLDISHGECFISSGSIYIKFWYRDSDSVVNASGTAYAINIT